MGQAAVRPDSNVRAMLEAQAYATTMTVMHVYRK
jgi:hypothetical protein